MKDPVKRTEPFRNELAELRLRISELEASESKFRESEELYRQMAESSPNPIFSIDKAGIIQTWNPSCENLLQYGQEIIGQHYQKLLRKSQSRVAVSEMLTQVFQGHPLSDVDMTYRRKDGTRCSMISQLYPIVRDTGEVYGCVFANTDVTKRMQAEEELRNSERRLRMIFEYAPDGYYLNDLKGTFVDGNKVAEKITGYKRDELIGKSFLKLKLLPRAQILNAAALLAKNALGVSTGPDEFTLDRKDGSQVIVEIRTFPVEIEGRNLVLGIARDITKRKKMEEELMASEERYRSLYSSMSEGVCLHKMVYNESGEAVDYEILDVNPSCEQILGLSRERAIGSLASELYGTGQPPPYIEIYAEVAESGRSICFQTYFPPMGKHFNISAFSPCKGQFATVFSDITENKRSEEELEEHRAHLEELVEGRAAELSKANAELQREIVERRRVAEALRASERRNKALLEAVPDLMFRISRDGIFLDFVPSKDMLTYVPPDEFLGKNLGEVFSTEKAQQAMYCINQSLQTGNTQVFEYQLPDPSSNGHMRDYEARYVASEKDEVFAIVRDVTERKKMEEELLKMDKLESVGVLAGGIAHDFNNLLTGIMGNISLAKMYAEAGTSAGKITERLTEADKASVRARELTRQLLTFAKGGAPIKEVAVVGDLLRDSAIFVSRGSSIRCKFSIPDDLRAAEVDKGQMAQVISNVVINAVEAMSNGGEISIYAENITVTAEHGLPLKPEEYIKISIEDHGGGIPREHLQKIFDPYFTTKQSGSGLGLAICYSIVEKHGGHITVESQSGVGSTFYIYLPAYHMEAPTDNEDVEEEHKTGMGRILVMDDERIIRELVCEILTGMGYKTVTALNGVEAIKLYRRAMESGNSFDAIILDLTIPGGMGGGKAIQKLKEIDPEVKAIVSSGYSNDPIMTNFSKHGFKGCIDKPYRPKKLGAVLHNVITGEVP